MSPEIYTSGVGRMPLILGFALLSAMLGPGCTTYVVPPANPADPVIVHLTDYGKHSSLLLPAPGGGYDEWAFGDWEYFAQGRTGWLIAARAMIGSPQSTLGRRHIPELEADQSLQELLGSRRLMSFEASRQRVDAVRLQLDGRFRRTGQPAFYSNYSELYHVHDEEHYWGGNNCNHVTAAWLRQLGCQIRGPAIFSNFIVTRPSATREITRRSRQFSQREH